MNLYFIGQYKDGPDGTPVLLRKVAHDLSFDAADVLTGQYNERLGHTVVDDCAIIRAEGVPTYYMFDDEEQ